MGKKRKPKPLIDVDKLMADVRRLVVGKALDNDQHDLDPYIKMMGDVPPEETVFQDTMAPNKNRGLNWMDAWRVVMDGKLLHDDAQGAMTVCCFAVVRLKAHVETLAKALEGTKPRIARTVRIDDALHGGRKKRLDKKTARYREIKAKVKQRLQIHPQDSLTYARNQVAANLGISFDTVNRATKGMEPTKKTKK